MVDMETSPAVTVHIHAPPQRVSVVHATGLRIQYTIVMCSYLYNNMSIVRSLLHTYPSSVLCIAGTVAVQDIVYLQRWWLVLLCPISANKDSRTVGCGCTDLSLSATMYTIWTQGAGVVIMLKERLDQLPYGEHCVTSALWSWPQSREVKTHQTVPTACVPSENNCYVAKAT